MREFLVLAVLVLAAIGASIGWQTNKSVTACPACGAPAYQPWTSQPHFECSRCGQRFDPRAQHEGATFAGR